MLILAPRPRPLIKPPPGPGTGMPGCFGHWPANEGGGLVLKDAAPLYGTGGGATLNGAGATWTQGPWGPCISLDGSTGFLDQPVHAIPYTAGIGTGIYPCGSAVLWFRTSASAPAHHSWIMGNASGASSNSGLYLLQLTTSNVLFFSCTATGAVSSITGTTAINDNSWHMAGIVFRQASGATNRLYLDGLAHGTATNSSAWDFNNGINDIRWGKSVDTFWGLFSGQIEPGAWFQRELAPAEFQELYRAGPPGLFGPPRMRAAFAASSAAGGLFRQPAMNGLGAGGPYFGDPLTRL